MNDLCPTPVEASVNRALIIDDHSFILTTVSLMLKNLGVGQIYTADTAEIAREHLEASPNPMDLIICDLNMPDEDGLVFLRNLGDAHRNSAIILLSAEDESILRATENLARSQQLNILGYAEKPLTLAKLEALLNNLKRNASPKQNFSQTELSLEELKEALAQDGLKVWYQPQIGCDDQRLHGFEALSRLIHPDKGLIPPDCFIPLAEQHNLIGEITDRVVNTSLEYLKQWINLNPTLKVSINFSAQSLQDLTFPDTLAAQCQAMGINNEQIVIELTESSLAANPATLLDILTRLRLKKFQLSIDDFGTGFSSLELLNRLPFTELKVDKGFVMKALKDGTSKHVVENSIRLARDLKLHTVAEGVEDQALLEFLAQTGCNLAQGFHISRPMPAEDVLEWMQKFAASLPNS